MNENNYATRWKQGAQLPQGFREKSRSILRDAVLSTACVLKGKSEDTFLRCLYCHHVFDDQNNDFERVVIKLKTKGVFIDTDTCIQMLQGERKIDKKYFHLSFDDGFRNNYTKALPILIKHAVPAIFFVPSALIESNWTDAKKYCVEIAEYPSVIEMLKWSDLREMVSLGYEIGSHTRTHARFSAISGDDSLMEDEIYGSKLEIEENIGSECKYISWPFGRLSDADDHSLNMAIKSGYTACFGAYRGTVIPGRTNIFRIPRHHFEVHWPISHILYFARGNREIEL